MGKVLILGSSGMLGSMVTQVASANFEVFELNRIGKSSLNGRTIPILEIDKPQMIRDYIASNKISFVVNCVGIIKQKMLDDSQESFRSAIQVNSLFPSHLAAISEEVGVETIQIATDCVFSGIRGKYSEVDLHDASDLYGRTKSLGEINSKNMHHLRVSIIGKELNSSHSLLDWVLNNRDSKSINGFVNHRWNGITTLAFAKIVVGILKNENFSNKISHVIPGDEVTKFELVSKIADAFLGGKLKVVPINAPESIDRTLITLNQAENQRMWQDAGYNEVPKVDFMVSELNEWLLGQKMQRISHV